MTTSFYNGMSGIKTYQYGVDVWGDNIANVNTAGYRSQEVDFKTLFSKTNTSTYTDLTINSPVVESDVGVGSTTAVTYMNTKEGEIKKTDNVFDLAIEGSGFSRVQDGKGEIHYTRAGDFSTDANSTLVNSNGEKVLGVNPQNIAKGVTKEGKEEWQFNPDIDTTNIFSNTEQVEPLTIPESLVYPAQPTKKITLSGNLNSGEIADEVQPANENSNFGVLYTIDGKNMNITDGQNIVIGMGDNITYENGVIKIDNCIEDDKVDGKEVNIDFDVNGENIKLTLPDGSTKKEIVDAVAQQLDAKKISYEKTENGIAIKSPDKLTIKNNGGDFFQNASAEVLTYQSAPDTSKGEFKTINDFTTQLQNLANEVYPNTTGTGAGVKVGIDEKGRIFIENDEVSPIRVTTLKGTNTNDSFFDNLRGLSGMIDANKTNSSLSFNHSAESFTGSIFDKDGNQKSLKFDFLKTAVDDTQTIWDAIIQEILDDGTTGTTLQQQLTFDNKGGLLSPETLNFNGITIDLGKNFDGLTSLAEKNEGFNYFQDGVGKGDLTQYDVDNMGRIVAQFSNGESGVVGAIPVYHFQNEQGLDSIGGQDYIETENSGKAFTYQNSEGKYIVGGKVINHALELSNVSMSDALTKLIVMQKAFDSNAKAITTSDEMIKRAIDMKK